MKRLKKIFYIVIWIIFFGIIFYFIYSRNEYNRLNNEGEYTAGVLTDIIYVKGYKKNYIFSYIVDKEIYTTSVQNYKQVDSINLGELFLIKYLPNKPHFSAVERFENHELKRLYGPPIDTFHFEELKEFELIE